jgi:predicted nucleic-acid-binding Zn-ribbon protein
MDSLRIVWRRNAMGQPCAKCGSRKVIPDAEILDQGQASDGTLKAKYDRRPFAFFNKGRSSTRLLARICVQCGYTELYAEHAEVLDEAYRDVLEQEENE